MKKVKMTVPNKSYNGYYGGVAFHNGIGEFTDIEAAKDLAERYGYKIEEIGFDTDIDTKVSTNVETEVEIEEEVKPKRKPRKAKAKVGE